jgi:hypothetical protein
VSWAQFHLLLSFIPTPIQKKTFHGQDAQNFLQETLVYKNIAEGNVEQRKGPNAECK